MAGSLGGAAVRQLAQPVKKTPSLRDSDSAPCATESCSLREREAKPEDTVAPGLRLRTMRDGELQLARGGG